jgi:hypothetical protein
MVALFGDTSFRKLEAKNRQIRLLQCMARIARKVGGVVRLHYMIVVKTELWLGSVPIVDTYGREHE